MNNIEVGVLHEAHHDPSGMMMFLAKLTQRGHNINTMKDLHKLYITSFNPSRTLAKRVAALPHGTIKRFTPITIAIVGASRRFLAQARTHHTGINFVSASLQYSDYSDKARFTVPYEILESDSKLADNNKANGPVDLYLSSCNQAMDDYVGLVSMGFSNDTAGYVAPQGLRNILIMQANHEAWLNFIRARACKRNTTETMYVTLLIWQALLNTEGGKELFAYAGPDCLYGSCREGKMCCCDPFITGDTPGDMLQQMFPVIKSGWEDMI